MFLFSFVYFDFQQVFTLVLCNLKFVWSNSSDLARNFMVFTVHLLPIIVSLIFLSANALKSINLDTFL